MKVVETAIPGVVLLEPVLHGDSRGYFFESFSQREFQARVCRTTFVQDNESMSRYGVVRGLHFQLPPHAQSKLVRVVRGRVWDVAVDIRRGSPTFGRHVAVELTEERFSISRRLNREPSSFPSVRLVSIISAGKCTMLIYSVLRRE